MYQREFGRTAQWFVAAPGRVNLIGEHTDYNDGYVLPMAIDRYVVMAAGPCAESPESGGATARFHSVELGETSEVHLQRNPGGGPVTWARYVQGVVAGFLARDVTLPAFDAVIQSTVPPGGGLSSSAALEVATATLLEAIVRKPLDPVEKAILCQQAEHASTGVPCGIMDQFSSIFGQTGALMLLDCRSQEVQMIPFASSDVTVLIANSNVKRQLTGGEYARRRAECDLACQGLGTSSLRDTTLQELDAARERLGDPGYRRARHVISENDRTVRAAAAIREGRWHDVGQLMYASHESLRDDFEVSCAELDLLVDLARESGRSGGVYGSRMTGAGFGGCTVSLVKTDCQAALAESLRSRYWETTGVEPDIFACQPAGGAHVLRV